MNAIFGNTGNNILDGGAGADVMIGGLGNDAYFVDNVSDQTIENPGEGNDTVFSTADFRLAANLENLVLQGTADLQGYGNGAVNAIFGNSGNNILDGGAGADAMIGGAGNDAYIVDNAGDAVVENAGEGNDTVFASVNYALTANVDNLVLQGGADLQGHGNSAVNAVIGNSGNNLLNGEGGADVLTGNAGNDTFIFSVGQGQRRHRRGLQRQRRGGGRFVAVRRLRRGRQLHQHRRDALADQLQWRRLTRHHHIQQRCGNRCDRLPVRVRTETAHTIARGRSDGGR